MEVDGTLVPVCAYVAASSRSYRFSANVQVIVDADSRLVIASARPFARMKNRKILRDRRQKERRLHHAVQAVATMHNLAMTR
ncbi:hypothetical protein QF048_000214 [Streptomyces sp. W4I9-2]|nr:hypothetical protein [Streptomyces sp. W4I9-2]